MVWPHRHEHDKGLISCLTSQDLIKATPFGGLCWGNDLIRFLKASNAFARSLPIRLCLMVARAGTSTNRFWDLQTGCVQPPVMSSSDLRWSNLAFAGCMPWVPSGLSYRELLPAAARGLSPATPPDDPAMVTEQIRWHLGAAEAPNATRRIDSLIGAFFKSRLPCPVP